jgi:CRISPR/Cas system CSM-associated protein Csm3 (group 7 of RAMP superfamily)
MAFDRDSQQPPAPKPYSLLDFPADTRIERQMPVGHASLREDLLSGWIELELEALTPVHVATGLLRLIEGQRTPVVRELVRVGGTPVIPGSSFKGCIRAIVEAISASCVRATRSRDLPQELQACSSKERLCVACRIFGAQDFQGQIRFSDFRLSILPRCRSSSGHVHLKVRIFVDASCAAESSICMARTRRAATARSRSVLPGAAFEGGWILPISARRSLGWF